MRVVAAVAFVMGVGAWGWLACVPLPASPCSSSADCRPENRCTEGTCQPFVAECTSNAQCLDKHPGEPWRCRTDQGRCVALQSTDCDVVLGEDAQLRDDGAIYLGMVLPTSGGDASTGQPMRNSVELARRDFQQLAGLPPVQPGGRRRPLVFVSCTDEFDANRAAAHLADEVGVPAIIGAAFSGVTLGMAQNVTLSRKVLLISPSATSTLITGLPDDGLVWRTSPPDTLQAKAVAGAVAAREAAVRTAFGLMGSDALTVAVLNKGDSYGTALADALFETLVFNGMPVSVQENNVIRCDYGNPDDPTNTMPQTGYTACINQALTRRPHLVIAVGTNEAVTSIMPGIEMGWGAGQRPFYVFTDGGKLPELTNYVAAAGAGADALRARIVGSVPGTNNGAFGLFKQKYNSSFPTGPDVNVFGTAGAYDAAYLLAYAIAGLRDRPITGPNLVTGLRRLVPPAPKIAVGSAAINNAFTALTTTDSNVDFDGASGLLDFDVETGEARSDIQVWAVARGMTAGTYVFADTGLFYDSADDRMEGTLVIP